MPSRYDDEIWALVSQDPGPPPEHLTEFVRGLGTAGVAGRALGAGPVRRALDLGAGDGRLTAFLQAEEVTAADASRVALERAGRRLPDATLLTLEPDEPLPLEDGSFDLVLCAETIEHVRDVQLLLSEARRVLRPGGALAVTTPAHGRLTALGLLVGGFERGFDPLSPHLRYFTRRSLRTVLETIGFEVVSLRRRRGTLLALARR